LAKRKKGGDEMAKTLSTLERLKRHEPLEVWATADGTWKWEVYKKYQKNDDQPYARWFCKVKSPFTDGDLGDVYVAEIKKHAIKLR
jgi:hypothetical protein